MTEQLLRLGKSFIPQEADRLISINHAADALLAEVAEMPGNMPSKIMRHLAPIVRRDCERMVNGEVFAIEITNQHLHLGCIHVRGLYQPVKCANDIGGSVIRFLVSFDGLTTRRERELMPRTIETLLRSANGKAGR